MTDHPPAAVPQYESTDEYIARKQAEDDAEHFAGVEYRFAETLRERANTLPNPHMESGAYYALYHEVLDALPSENLPVYLPYVLAEYVATAYAIAEHFDLDLRTQHKACFADALPAGLAVPPQALR